MSKEEQVRAIYPKCSIEEDNEGQVVIYTGERNATVCPLCGESPTIEAQSPPHPGYDVYCRDCYDGAPDSSVRYLLGYGTTKKDAVCNWNQAVEWYEDTEGYDDDV